MRTLIFILGTIGLLMLFGVYSVGLAFGETEGFTTLDVLFFLGFALCCVTWLLLAFRMKRSNEDGRLFEAINEPVFIINRNSRMIMCINQSTIDLLGFRREDLLYRAASHLFAGNETIVEKLVTLKNQKSNASAVQTASAMRKDGSLVEMQLTIRPVQYQGSDCIIINGRDMSKKMQALEDQSRLAAILKSSVAGLCACNREGIIINWNTAATKIFGYRDKEVLGKPFMMLINEENRKARWTMYKDLLDGKTVPAYEGEARHKNGNPIYVYMDVSSIRNADGEVVGVSAIFHDVGQNKKNEKELEENTQRLRIALQSAQLGLWDYDCANDSFVVLSELSQKLFGYDPDETSWNYQKIRGLIHPLDRQQSDFEFQRVLKNKADTPLNIMARFHIPSGGYRWTRISGQVTERDEEGLPIRIIGVNQDISREMADRQRAESEKLRIKTLLAWSERTNASREDIIDFTLQKAVELTDSSLGLIGQIDQETKQLHISWLIQGVWPNKVGGLASHKTTAERFAINGSPLWTKAIHTGEPVSINNPNLDTKDRNFFGVHNPIERYMTVPILEEGRIAGVVMVANKEEAYESHDVIELQLLAQGMWNHLRKTGRENAPNEPEPENNILLENLPEEILDEAQGHQDIDTGPSTDEGDGASVEETFFVLAPENPPTSLHEVAGLLEEMGEEFTPK